MTVVINDLIGILVYWYTGVQLCVKLFITSSLYTGYIRHLWLESVHSYHDHDNFPSRGSYFLPN